VAQYLRMVPPDVPIVPAGDDDVPVVVLEPEKTKQSFAWKASIGFRETIQRQLKWYDAHGVTDIHSHLAAPTPK